MCGIVGILRRTTPVFPPSADHLLGLARQGGARLTEAAGAERPGVPLRRAVEDLIELDGELKRIGAVALLVDREDLACELDRICEQGMLVLETIERRFESDEVGVSPAEVEELNAALVAARDALWAIHRDRTVTARAVRDLGRGASSPSAVRALLSVQQALSALDRLEVRGRDSAGLVLALTGHGLDLASRDLRALERERSSDPLLRNGAVRRHDGCLSLIYKTAAEIGELGDNVARLRAAVRSDPLFEAALRSGDLEVAVLGHTRWASVGIISEPNAHPLDERERDSARVSSPVLGVLNGDVDNYAELAASAGLRLADEITTDAKVIPVLLSRRLERGAPFDQAFLETVASFAGSVAVGAIPLADPDRLGLALCGSGQALYVGLGEDAFVVASEPYGLVEETSTYLRLDGETPADPGRPNSRGQVVVLDRRRAGELGGITRRAYDGTPLPVARGELRQAEITTRDVDRGGFRHFLLKEISESPTSFARTLRGRLREGEDGRLRVVLDERAVPDAVAERLRGGGIRRVYVIGQGTAAVAGGAIAEALRRLVQDRGVQVTAMPGTELSGFHLRDDMRDTLVIAVSQSGTTTDTNRTVDLVRARGAAVLAVVNRRHSDLTDKADGVLYTSDGRDVEMSVASTKAFYAQVAAGFLLAVALADLMAAGPRGRERGEEEAGRRSEGTQDLLRALRGLPEAMRQTLAGASRIADIARRHAPPRRHWALAGNGWNRFAAAEIRIKLSELCYKSIACDVTEDKKHIDLSSEPLILVCAAGLSGSNARDVAKEVAIYRAHKATPIVIAPAGSDGFAAAAERIDVPPTHPDLAFVLCAVAGHVFGYHAALAIDEQARPLRETRAAIERLAGRISAGEHVEDLLAELHAQARGSIRAFTGGVAARRYDGHLEASTAVALMELLRFVDGSVPLGAYVRLSGRAGSPQAVVEDLTGALSRAIDELTRPIDAIKHQAKTVTVGISRSDEALLLAPLVREALATGLSRDQLDYGVLRTLAALDPVVVGVRGHTRYRIAGDPASEGTTIDVVSSGGVARGLPSRTAANPLLKGTKRRVAMEGQVLVGRGEADDRLFILVPEMAPEGVRGLLLLHVELRQRASAAVLRGVLKGYRDRYDEIRDLITETEAELNEELLEELSVEALLTAPVETIARRVTVAG